MIFKQGQKERKLHFQGTLLQHLHQASNVEVTYHWFDIFSRFFPTSVSLPQTILWFLVKQDEPTLIFQLYCHQIIIFCYFDKYLLPSHIKQILCFNLYFYQTYNFYYFWQLWTQWLQSCELNAQHLNKNACFTANKLRITLQFQWTCLSFYWQYMRLRWIKYLIIESAVPS